jgi:nucleotide-binding universal stress UspA family protein
LIARKLIIAYDGSEHGEDALALGAVLADCLAAKPVVATVLPHLSYLHESEELAEAVERDSEPIFRAARARLGEREVETRPLVDASPARALHELAEEAGPIAVALGSPHRGRLGRVLLGSVGSALLSGAPCAIAVAPRGYAEREKRSVLRVGVGFDGSEESWPALEAASALAGRLRASLTLVGVVEPVRYGYVTPYPVLDPNAPDNRQAREAEMSRVLDRALDRTPEDLSAERRRMRGDPATLIAQAAEELDLLLLGSRGYGPIRRTLLGGVSAKVMEIAPCPVLVLPRAAGADPLGLHEVQGGALTPPGD